MRISRRSLRKALVLVGCLWGQLESPGVWIGLALTTVGTVLHGLSKAYLEQNRELTSAGPYRFTRNPFYLANFLIDAGIACVIGRSWIAGAYFACWALAYRATIRDEEARLRELFGERYVAYAKAVPRFWPLRKPLDRTLARGRFDWQNPNLVAGREYARLLGIALAPATIWAAERLRTERVGILDPQSAVELGLVLFVPALWVVKLGLAETFRRPGTELLGRLAGAVPRALASVAALAPLVAVLIRGDAPVLGGAGVLLGAAAVVSSLSTRVGRVRILGEAAQVAASLALGAAAGALAWAVLPALWFSICLLDAVGRRRRSVIAPIPADSSRRDWRYFPRIALAVSLGAVLLGFAQGWVY